MILQRDLYHCTPAELGEQDYARVMIDLAVYGAEQEVNAAKRKAARDRSSNRGRFGLKGNQ